MNFFGIHNKLKEDFETYLKKVFDKSDAPIEILEAMQYSLFSGGKRLRPAMALYLARELGIDDKVSLPLCAAIEMIHTYSLIHDDLPAMDNDNLRRGKPTCHVKFGEDIAILAGDGLLNFAFELMLDNYPKEDGDKYIKAVRYIAECSGIGGMIGGQVMDVEKSAKDLKALEKMHSLKTGKMFSACIMPMVYIAGLSAEEEKIYLDFSQNFGLLFQITDDILDVKGQTESIGKTAGKDETQGKITYVNQYGLQEAEFIAEKTRGKCLELLKKTGVNQAYLSMLVDYILRRKT